MEYNESVEKLLAMPGLSEEQKTFLNELKAGAKLSKENAEHAKLAHKAMKEAEAFKAEAKKSEAEADAMHAEADGRHAEAMKHLKALKKAASGKEPDADDKEESESESKEEGKKSVSDRIAEIKSGAKAQTDTQLILSTLDKINKRLEVVETAKPAQVYKPN